MRLFKDSISFLICSNDDSRRNLIKFWLQEMGASDVFLADSIRDALNKAFQYHPRVILFDVNQEELDASVFVQLIRQHPEGRAMILIAVENVEAKKPITQVYKEAIDDVIHEESTKEELFFRLECCLHHEKTRQELQQVQAMLMAEIEEAKRMQASLLPNVESLRMMKEKFGVVISSHVHPSAMLGGDMWGITMLSETKFAIYTVDFSGHGVMAAINTFRLHAIMQEHPNTDESPGEYLAKLNQLMFAILPRGNFATMFYGVCDIEKDMLEYACAAAPDTPLWNGHHHQIEILSGAGFPLGILKTAKFETKCTSFPKGSTLMLYSDALFETEDERGKCFAEEAIHQYMTPLVQGELKVDTQQALLLLTQHFQGYFGKQLQDDLTVCLLQRS